MEAVDFSGACLLLFLPLMACVWSAFTPDAERQPGWLFSFCLCHLIVFGYWTFRTGLLWVESHAVIVNLPTFLETSGQTGIVWALQFDAVAAGHLAIGFTGLMLMKSLHGKHPSITPYVWLSWLLVSLTLLAKHWLLFTIGWLGVGLVTEMLLARDNSSPKSHVMNWYRLTDVGLIMATLTLGPLSKLDAFPNLLIEQLRRSLEIGSRETGLFELVSLGISVAIIGRTCLFPTVLSLEKLHGNDANDLLLVTLMRGIPAIYLVDRFHLALGQSQIAQTVLQFLPLFLGILHALCATVIKESAVKRQAMLAGMLAFTIANGLHWHADTSTRVMLMMIQSLCFVVPALLMLDKPGMRNPLAMTCLALAVTGLWATNAIIDHAMLLPLASKESEADTSGNQSLVAILGIALLSLLVLLCTQSVRPQREETPRDEPSLDSRTGLIIVAGTVIVSFAIVFFGLWKTTEESTPAEQIRQVLGLMPFQSSFRIGYFPLLAITIASLLFAYRSTRTHAQTAHATKQNDGIVELLREQFHASMVLTTLFSLVRMSGAALRFLLERGLFGGLLPMLQGAIHNWRENLAATITAPEPRWGLICLTGTIVILFVVLR